MIKLLLTIIFIVSSLAGGLYATYPLYEDYQKQLQENEVLKEELENLMVYIADLKEIERKIEENEEEFEKMKSALPEDHDAPSLFLYLQELMEENNLRPEREFGEFSMEEYLYGEKDEGGEQQTHRRVKETSFELSLLGSYEDIKNFLKETENVIRLISINDIVIESGEVDEFDFGRFERGDTEERRVLNIIISASTYSY